MARNILARLDNPGWADPSWWYGDLDVQQFEHSQQFMGFKVDTADNKLSYEYYMRDNPTGITSIQGLIWQYELANLYHRTGAPGVAGLIGSLWSCETKDGKYLNEDLDDVGYC